MLRNLTKAFLMTAALGLLGISLDAQPPQGPRKPPLALVELFALPGAGKSTIVAAAANRSLITTRKDLSAEWEDSPTLRRLFHVGRAFGTYGRLIAAVRFAVGARIATPESQFRLMRLIAKTEWLRSRSGVVLLDQGFLQDLWSILLSGKSACADPAILASLIRTLYEGIDATIVVFEVDPEIASARIMGRTHGRSRFDGLPEGQARNSLHAAIGMQRQIIEAARLAGLPVRTVDGSLAADVVTDRLLALLPAVEPRKNAGQNSQRPRRISVVGATGSGKTSLARELAERLDLPICELDQLRRDTVVGGLSAQTFQSRVAEIAQRDAWIIDGHYRDVRHLIWSRAEAVVWLNYPLRIVALRLMGRFRQKRRARAFGADQSSEPRAAARLVADEGASWTRRLGRLVRTLRERSVYGRLLRSAEYRGVRTIELRSLEATRQWLRNL